MPLQKCRELFVSVTIFVPYTKRGDKYDTCVINKIRIWVDVFGGRKGGEMEINDHFYSTAHFFPKQLKNSCKSRSGELKNSSGKFFWGRIFQSGSKTRLWLHAPSTWWSICSALSSSDSTTRYSSFPLRWNSWSDLWGKQLWRWQAAGGRRSDTG